MLDEPVQILLSKPPTQQQRSQGQQQSEEYSKARLIEQRSHEEIKSFN